MWCTSSHCHKKYNAFSHRNIKSWTTSVNRLWSCSQYRKTNTCFRFLNKLRIASAKKQVRPARWSLSLEQSCSHRQQRLSQTLPRSIARTSRSFTMCFKKSILTSSLAWRKTQTSPKVSINSRQIWTSTSQTSKTVLLARTISRKEKFFWSITCGATCKICTARPESWLAYS